MQNYTEKVSLQQKQQKQKKSIDEARKAQLNSKGKQVYFSKSIGRNPFSFKALSHSTVIFLSEKDFIYCVILLLK